MLEINDIIIILGFLFGVLLFWSAKSLKPGTNASNIKISVVIPVRNEAHNIAHLLSNLKKQTYDIYEIICVDDGSEDNTREVVGAFDVTLISAGELPDGWRGKAWACQQGASHASGDVLLFIDADVGLRLEAVEALASNFAAGRSCISVQPYHRTEKPYEQASMFFNEIQAMATGMGMPFGVKSSGLFGPVLMISRDLFFEYGGYSEVKDKAVEDYLLGRYYSKKNIDLKLYLGGRYISYRMYPLGLQSLIEGWTKNFSSGAVNTRWWSLLMIAVYITALTALPIEIIQSIVRTETVRLLCFAAVYVLFVLCLAITVKKLGSFSILTCVLYPAALLAFLLIFIYSAVCTFVLKCTTWKGRKL